MAIQDWDLPVAAPELENAILRVDLGRALRRARSRLTEEQRTALDLAYGEGLTHRELAARLKRPLGTVKTWVRSALQTLRGEMAMYRQEA
jgi:RNA polymerase sigma-70 factor (ECF subfamily)